MKQTSIVCTVSTATYEEIQYAVEHNDLKHKLLKSVVTMCRAHPETVACLVYKPFHDSVLVISGKDPTCVCVEATPVPHHNEHVLFVYTFVQSK